MSERGAERRWVRRDAPRNSLPRGLGPDRSGIVAIVLVARNHVPVQVLRDVAEACEVDFVGAEKIAQRGLGGEHRVHEPHALVRCEVGHFLYVPLQDYPAEAGVIGIVDENDATELVAPEQVPSRGGAQLAGHAGKDSRIGAGYGLSRFDGVSDGTALSGKMSR